MTSKNNNAIVTREPLIWRIFLEKINISEILKYSYLNGLSVYLSAFYIQRVKIILNS